MEEKKKSGFGTASVVLGIIGICTSFIPIVNNLSFVLGLIGGIFAIVSLIKKASKGQAIAGIILCVLAMVITVNSQKALSDSLSNRLNEVSANLDKATGSSTEEILANDVDAQLGNFEVTNGSYGIKDTKLTVKVTNKTSEKKSFNLHIEAVDASGARINEDYVFANDLSAGQSQNFDIFTYVSSDKLSAMQNATFKIVEASMY